MTRPTTQNQDPGAETAKTNQKLIQSPGKTIFAGAHKMPTLAITVPAGHNHNRHDNHHNHNHDHNHLFKPALAIPVPAGHGRG